MGMKRICHSFCYMLIHTLPVLKTHIHFTRMDIYVHVPCRHIYMQDTEREFMLHSIALVAILKTSCNNIIFNITFIQKIILKIPVRPVDSRRPKISIYHYTVTFIVDGYGLFCHIPSVYAVYNILKVSGS